MSWEFTPYEKISESSAQWDHSSAPKLFKKGTSVKGQVFTHIIDTQLQLLSFQCTLRVIHISYIYQIIRQQADIATKWVVTEKVHGANFCFLCDGTTTTCAKRTQVLDENDEFFGLVY